MKGIAITGMGMISSIGNDVEQSLLSLNTATDGLSYPEILETNLKNLPVGEIKLTNAQLAATLGLPADHAYTRAALLAVHAIRDLLNNSDISDAGNDTGLISATSVGGMDMTEKYFHQFLPGSSKNRFVPAQHPGFTTQKIAEYFGIKGYTTTISTACSSSANAILLGARLIEAGRLKRVIVGGTDCLTKFTLNGFNSLKILSDKKCRPFDEQRDGLNLGEAAAYLLLEHEDLVKNRKPLGYLSGYGNANDAYHQTASSETGEGAFLAISKALKKADISPETIDYINAHGTGTANNDLSESMALKRLYGNDMPSFSSTKGFTGHTLGAAGAVEAVISLLSIREQSIFANLNFSNSIPETSLTPVTSTKREKIDYLLSNSFGFGGNCTSLIFKNA